MIKLYHNVILGIIVSSLILSCNQNLETKPIVEDKLSRELIFEKGIEIKNTNFNGNAWLKMLIAEDSINRNSVGIVTFEPSSRTNWHYHPNGQIIISIGGEGYYQEKGGPKNILKMGDVVKCPPNLPHWHGASESQEFIQIAITSRIDGPTVWLDPVLEEEYHAKVN